MKSKIYSFFVDYRSEHKRSKGVNKNVVATISHKEYKDVLLNQKCLRQWMNRTQNKNHRIGANEINKISFSYFDEKIYIENNEYEGLAELIIKKTVILITILNSFFDKLILIFSLVRANVCQSCFYFLSFQSNFFVNLILIFFLANL